jgi:AbrB family looped-hinge helix DNA binding protein
MELAKVTSKGQITIPVEIRKKLGLKEGDKVLFIEEGEKVIMMNSTLLALKEAQKEFTGEAEKAGLKDEQDVVDFIKEMRKEKYR